MRFLSRSLADWLAGAASPWQGRAGLAGRKRALPAAALAGPPALRSPGCSRLCSQAALPDESAARLRSPGSSSPHHSPGELANEGSQLGRGVGAAQVAGPGREAAHGQTGGAPFPASSPCPPPPLLPSSQGLTPE